jgi:hypothetical protein
MNLLAAPPAYCKRARRAVETRAWDDARACREHGRRIAFTDPVVVLNGHLSDRRDELVLVPADPARDVARYELDQLASGPGRRGFEMHV